MFDLELLKVNREGIIRRIFGQIQESPARNATSSKNLPVSVNMNTCRSGGWLSSYLPLAFSAYNHSSLSSVGLILIFAFLLPNTVFSADLGAGLSACEGSGCRTTNGSTYSEPGVCFNQDTGGFLNTFRDEAVSILVGGDFIARNGAEAEGLIVILNDLIVEGTAGTYNMASVGAGACVVPPNGTDAVIVGGDMNIGTGGSVRISELNIPVTTGNLRIGGALANNGTLNGSPNVTVFEPNDATALSKTASFTTILDTQKSNSTSCYAVETPNGTTSGNAIFDGVNQTNLVVFERNTDITGPIRYQNIPASATVLINMTGSGTVTVNSNSHMNSAGVSAGFGAGFGDLRQRILWNFPNATEVVLSGSAQFEGSILIPNGNLTMSVPGLNGRIIVGGNITHDLGGSEFHNYDFIGNDLPTCSSSTTPLGSIEVTKNLSTGTTSPGSDWEYNLTTTTAGCTIPNGASPFTIPAAGGTNTISNLPVNGTSAACAYTATLTAKAGYSVTSTTGGTQNGDSVESITVTDGGTTAVAFTCSEDVSPTGSIEITKSLSGGTTPPGSDWQYNLTTSTAGCTIPGGTSPFTIPAVGGTKTISNLPMNGASAACAYTATLTAKAGYSVTSTTGGTQNGDSVESITVTDGGITAVGFTCSEDASPTGTIEITKSLLGGTTPPGSNWEYNLTTSTAGCTIPGGASPFTIPAIGGTKTISNLPVNGTSAACVYTATLTAKAGYSVASTTGGTQNGDSVESITVTDGGTTAVGFTCSEDASPTGSIEITKSLSAGTTPPGSDWQYNLTTSIIGCTIPDGASPFMIPAAGGTKTISNLPVNGASAACVYTATLTGKAGYLVTSTTGGTQNGDSVESITVTDGGTTAVGFTCSEDASPTGTIEITKSLSGGTTPPGSNWQYSLTTSTAGCTVPGGVSPFMILAAGGTATISNLPVNGTSAACEYTATLTAQAGYSVTSTTGGTQNGDSVESITVTDGGATAVGFTCSEDTSPTGTIEITKSLSTGTAAPGSDWQYSLTTSTAGCTIPGGASPFTIPAAGGIATISDLPVNGTSEVCEYIATLTAKSGYTVTSTNGAGIQNGDSVAGVTVNDGDTTAVGFICAVTDPNDAGVNGVVFIDQNKNGVQDPGEGGQSGWTIKIFDSAGSVVETLTTQADGTFTQPSLGTGDFTVQFISPGGLIMQEQQVSLTNGDQAFVPQPIDPAGVIYDEVTGAGVPSVQVFLTSGGTPVPAACVGAGEQGQITGVDGAYMFFVNPGADSACPAEDTVYELVVVPPTGFQASGNLPQASVLDADNCTIDAVAGITCEVSNQIAAPINGIPLYFIQIELGAGDPGVFNNHIPLNPLGGVSPPPPVIPVVPGDPAQKIPTLSEWARIILVTLMGLTALVQHRRWRKGNVTNLSNPPPITD